MQRHRNRFLARFRRRYFSAERSDSQKCVCVRRLWNIGQEEGKTEHLGLKYSSSLRFVYTVKGHAVKICPLSENPSNIPS